MNTRTILITSLLGVLFCLFVAVVYAAPQLVGLGTVYWSRTQTFTNGGDACFVEEQGSSDCAAVPSGSHKEHAAVAVVLEADGPLRCCVVGDGTLELNTGPVVTDASGPNGTGPGSCVEFGSNGGTAHLLARRDVLKDREASGYRPGLCTTEIESAGDDVFLPCLNSSDTFCGTRSAGSCTTDPGTNVVFKAGNFVVCEGVGADTQAQLRKERVSG